MLRQDFDEIDTVVKCWQPEIVLVCGIHQRLLRVYRQSQIAKVTKFGWSEVGRLWQLNLDCYAPDGLDETDCQYQLIH